MKLITILFITLTMVVFPLYAQLEVQSNGNTRIHKDISFEGSFINLETSDPAGTTYNVGLKLESEAFQSPTGLYSASLYPTNSALMTLGTDNNPFLEIWAWDVRYSTLSSISDSRVKENIKNISSGLETVKLLRPVSFDYKIGISRALENMPDHKLHERFLKNRYGFLAQEVGQVLPNIVKYDENKDLYSLEMVSLIPLLVKAVQEQNELINELREEVITLKSNK